jgi:hypothetical protein
VLTCSDYHSMNCVCIVKVKATTHNVIHSNEKIWMSVMFTAEYILHRKTAQMSFASLAASVKHIANSEELLVFRVLLTSILNLCTGVNRLSSATLDLNDHCLDQHTQRTGNVSS